MGDTLKFMQAAQMLGSDIRPWQKTKDGKNDFISLSCQFLGASNIDNMSNGVERNLELAHYNGETKRWNFDKYVKVHMEEN